ncbi:MAG: four helix bundle protein [Bacteroidota bacterium]
MTTKEFFISKLKIRTKKLAIDVIAFCETLKRCKASAVITYQLVKSATSVGANYRASCRARSKREFFSKICIVVEEADETEYWLEIIRDSKLSENLEQLSYLLKESNEITRIMSKAKDTAYRTR